ncbi:hypothetical protein QVD17_36512 [Tagetes erecta]|uniref:Uncharacterized protein n=1 Tax=Tagetes erecta TaxID=13708 RepID=A0AAD8NJ25_TARER|nr:hypothetical protein QVD17_36512 [Tagetes erecta]
MIFNQLYARSALTIITKLRIILYFHVWLGLDLENIQHPIFAFITLTTRVLRLARIELMHKTPLLRLVHSTSFVTL